MRVSGDQQPVDVAHIADLMVVDLQPSERLPDVAAAALVDGLDSPSLRTLAGTPATEVREARDLFLAALAELGIALPTPDQARWNLVRSWADDIVSDRVAPNDGAHRIWQQAFWQLGAPEVLTVFVGLADEWDDHEGHRGELDTAIREAARQYLDHA